MRNLIYYITANIVFILGLSLAASAQNTTGSFIYDGILREYRLYVPATYTGEEAVPLLLNLHGYGSNNIEQEFYGNFRQIADTANFIIALPNGTIDQLGKRFWNVGFAPSNIDDTGFLNALIDTLASNYAIDTTRLYSTGMSNGGFMSYELACNTDRLAAIASVTGSITHTHLANCSPTKPMPVLQIHGTNDPTVPYDGSALFAPIETVVQYWVNYNQCNPIPEIIPIPNTNLNDGATAEHIRYTNGENNTAVEFFKVYGGEHTWPGAIIDIGVTCKDFNASIEIWRFLSRYTSANTATNTATTAYNQTTLYGYPNPTTQQINLAFDAAKTPQKIIVYDNLGQIVWQHNINSSTPKVEINTQNWAKGIYIAIAYGANPQQTYRFIVQ